ECAVPPIIAGGVGQRRLPPSFSGGVASQIEAQPLSFVRRNGGCSVRYDQSAVAHLFSPRCEGSKITQAGPAGASDIPRTTRNIAGTAGAALCRLAVCCPYCRVMMKPMRRDDSRELVQRVWCIQLLRLQP